MLPTSTKVPDRFTPEGSETTYLIEIPDSIGKARYRRAMKAIGARIWPQYVMVSSARASIDMVNPSNAEDLIAICNRFEQLSDEMPAGQQKEVIEGWIALSRILQSTGGDFAARVADNEFWMELSPLMAARCFLIGTETGALKRGADGMIPIETLEAAIEEGHISPIGWRAMALFSPSEAEAKNSASPQPSPSGPANSTAASRPQTEVPGTSSGSDTTEIQS